METASLSVLDYAARFKENVLLNRYRSGKRQIEQHRKDGPFAYFIPQAQRDAPTAVELLRRLAFGGIRVSQLTAPVTAEGETFPAGTWVIPDRSGIHRAGARSPRSADTIPIFASSTAVRPNSRTTPPAGRCR